ncbi:hypothetical protein PspLS_02848 [Pyricularia sp. CBS 133598]|nr:hypothetical protein PspLS_02848 [Pyricularia sp. CBS 133598]
MRSLDRSWAWAWTTLLTPLLALADTDAAQGSSNELYTSAYITLDLAESSPVHYLDIQLGVLQKQEPCAPAHILLNHEPLEQGNNGNFISLSDGIPFTATWNITCVEVNGLPASQLFSFAVESVSDIAREQPLGFSLQFKQNSPGDMFDLKGPASMEVSQEKYQQSMDEGTPEDFMSKVDELRRLRRDVVHLHRLIRRKEMHLARRHRWEEEDEKSIGDCEDFKCMVKTFAGEGTDMMMVGVIVTDTGLIGDTLTGMKVTVRRTMDGDFHRHGSGLIIGIDLHTGRRRDLPMMGIRFILTIHQAGRTIDLTHHQGLRIRPNTIDPNTIHRGQHRSRRREANRRRRAKRRKNLGRFLACLFGRTADDEDDEEKEAMLGSRRPSQNLTSSDDDSDFSDLEEGWAGTSIELSDFPELPAEAEVLPPYRTVTDDILSDAATSSDTLVDDSDRDSLKNLEMTTTSDCKDASSGSGMT